MQASKAPAQFATYATGREILAQPDIWRDRGIAFAAQLDDYTDWIKNCGATEIWLCGAGTSAYIGDLVAKGIGRAFGVPLRSVPTTDFVSGPRLYLLPGVTPLVISFGRSGDSAESIGTLDVLDELAPNAPRLNITCNPTGALANRASPGPQRIICLPESTHDTGFAMTSSYTTMLLTALALLDEQSADFKAYAAVLSKTAAKLLPRLRDWGQTQQVAERVVFVGSRALTFAARESALKVMELTCGQIPVLWESALGFRHGPKSFVTKGTHILMFTSSDHYTAKYDADLIRELRDQFPDITISSVGPDSGSDIQFDTGLPDTWNAVLHVLVAQVLALYWSAKLGLNVDDPFAGQGTLTHVVSGVKLYSADAL